MLATGRWDQCTGNSPARPWSNSVRELIHSFQICMPSSRVFPFNRCSSSLGWPVESVLTSFPSTIHRRDSITEEITITSTTNSSQSTKLLTIQEAAGSFEQSSVSAVSTSSKQIASTTAGGSPPAAAAPGANEFNGSVLRLTQAATSTSPGSISSAGNTATLGAAPSINIVSSESTRDQSQQPQGVDPNGVAAPGDSPSSRKSSTSSKGKASQAKLSTSSSGRDEVSSNGLRVGFKAALGDHVAGS